MIKNADRSNKFDAVKRFSSFFSTCLQLFVRASHAFASGAYLSTFIKRSFSDSRLQICPTFTFPRSVLSKESAVTGAYSQVLRFVPVFSSALRVCAAWLRSRSHSETLCWTAVGAQRCRKEAALTGNSGRCSSGKAGTKGAECVGALLRTNQPKLNTTHLTAKHNFFNTTSNSCVKVFTCKNTSRFPGDLRSVDVGSFWINTWKSIKKIINHPEKTKIVVLK